MNLAEYVKSHVERGECKCGRCIDLGTKPDPEGVHTVDMTFFKTALVGEANAQDFERLTNEWNGQFTPVNVFDGHEHGYMELGGWLGSQDLAIQYMALGVMLGIFKLISPLTLLEMPSEDPEAQRMARNGFLWIIPHPEFRKVLPDAGVQVPGP